MTADQIGDQVRHPIVVALPPPVFDGDVLAFDIAGLRQSLMKIGQICARLVMRCQVRKSDRRHRRLLRPRRQRPGRRRTEQREAKRVLAPGYKDKRQALIYPLFYVLLLTKDIARSVRPRVSK